MRIVGVFLENGAASVLLPASGEKVPGRADEGQSRKRSSYLRLDEENFHGALHSKLAPSLRSPLPEYFATCG